VITKPNWQEVEDLPQAILDYHAQVFELPVLYEKGRGPQECVDGQWLGGDVLSPEEATERRIQPHENEIAAPEDEDFDLDHVEQLIEGRLGDQFMVRPNSSQLNRALAWLWPLIGEMPYGWWTKGAVPDGQPAYAINTKLRDRAYYRRRTVFCAGVVNLLLRAVGKRVPTFGNLSLDGGTGAMGSYFRAHAKPFRLSDVQPGDLILDFYVNSTHQGHTGVVLNGNLFLQSFDGNRSMEGGFNGPGLNKLYTIGQSASVTGYDVRIPRNSWINYRGDEAGFAAVA
jgi:hypothetical protein